MDFARRHDLLTVGPIAPSIQAHMTAHWPRLSGKMSFAMGRPWLACPREIIIFGHLGHSYTERVMSPLWVRSEFVGHLRDT